MHADYAHHGADGACADDPRTCRQEQIRERARDRADRFRRCVDRLPHQGEDHGSRGGKHDALHQRRRRRTARLEQPVAEPTRGKSARDASDAAPEAPVLRDHRHTQRRFLGEQQVPVQDAVAEHAGGEFNNANHQDDGVTEDLPDQLEVAVLFVLCFIIRGVMRIERIKSCLIGPVSQEHHVNQCPHDHDHCWDQEDQPQRRNRPAIQDEE